MRACDVTVWWGHLDGAADRLERLLSPDERSRAAAFRFPRDRSRFVAARGWLRKLLGDHLGLDPRRIEFDYGKHGKPRLADGEVELRFNVSHSNGVVALAFCQGREIGVDVEERRDDLFAFGIARHYLPERVATEIEQRAGNERSAEFFRAWVRQEAYAKGRGIGLEAIGEDPADWSIADLDLLDGYAAALAAEGPTPVRVITKPLTRPC
jgi:4'-phosphopantetheinyl transferase